MIVIAITIKGQEFIYNASTAHKVNEKKADIAIKALNEAGYKIDKNAGEIWHKYNVDKYDRAYDYAQFQRFTVGNKIKEIISY